MARLNICGFETGDLSEAYSSDGTISVQSTTKRTGGYALRINPTSSTGNVQLGKLNTDGTKAALAGSTFYARAYVKFTTLNSTNVLGFYNDAAQTTQVCRIQLSGTGGNALIRGATDSAAVACFTTGVWHLIELFGVQNGTCEFKVDGVSKATCTGANSQINYLNLGTGAAGFAATYDAYFDDIAIDDAAYPGAGQVNICVATGTQSFAAWTNGAGTTPTNVAEVPPDSDTSYITTSANARERYNVTDAAAAGVSGAIAAVKTVGILRDEGGASSIKIGLGSWDATLSSVTLVQTTGADPGASYAALCRIDNTDPQAAGAWTSGAIDRMVVEVQNINAVTVRCTALYAMVECSGAVAATGYTNLPLMGVG